METHSLEPILREHAFFQGMAKEHIDLLVGCASNARFSAGDKIYKTGDPADHFWIIRTGKVALEVNVPHSGDVIIQTLREGDILGWSWLFPPHTMGFDSRAVELTRVIAVDAKCLRKKCDEDHDFGYEMMKRFSALLVEHLRATRLQLIDVYASPARTGR